MPEYLIEKSYKVFQATEFWSNKAGCKLWPKSTDTGGYGLIVFKDEERRSRHFGAHRVAWELANGPIPEGLWICHKCDERRCCNAEHMFLGTEEDNFKDMWAKRRNPMGSRNSWAVLVEEQVAEIVKLLPTMSNKTIAQQFKVSQTCISSIRIGKTWGHFTGRPRLRATTAVDKSQGGE